MLRIDRVFEQCTYMYTNTYVTGTYHTNTRHTNQTPYIGLHTRVQAITTHTRAHTHTHAHMPETRAHTHTHTRTYYTVPHTSSYRMYDMTFSSRWPIHVGYRRVNIYNLFLKQRKGARASTIFNLSHCPSYFTLV